MNIDTEFNVGDSVCYLSGDNIIHTLNSQQAFSVIYYLQEHLPVFPDTIEKCDRCGELFDLFYSGTHCDVCGNLCESCDDCLCNKED